MNNNLKSQLTPGLSAKEEDLGKCIVHAAYLVHSRLGPGLLKSIYETCFCHELNIQGLAFQRQVSIPLIYDGLRFEEGLRLDVLVEDMVICELKSVEEMKKIYFLQTLSQLKLSGKRLGYLINFNVPLIKNGIHRLIN